MRSLLSDAGFQIALAIAAVGAVSVAFVSRRSHRNVGFAVVTLVAALVAMRIDLQLGWRLVVGLLLLAVAGRPPDDRVGRVLRFVLLVAGAGFVVASMSGAAGWMRVLGFAAMLVGVPATNAVDRRAARVVPLLLLISAVGIHICVPDTEYTKVVIAALVPVAFLVFDRELRAAAPTGAVTALLVWTAIVEGRGRPGAVVGGLACLGVLVLVPATGWAWRRTVDVLGLVAVDLVTTLYVARIAGFRASAWVAAVLALPVLLLAWVVIALTSRRQ